PCPHRRAAAREVYQLHAVYHRTSTGRERDPSNTDLDSVSPDFDKLLPALTHAGIEFILVGGVAGIVHGSARATYDVDLVYSRTDENIERLASVLAPHSPYLRGAPLGLPFGWNAKTIRNGLNFTLTTDLGDIDLFGEIAGGGTYQELLAHSVELEAF